MAEMLIRITKEMDDALKKIVTSDGSIIFSANNELDVVKVIQGVASQWKDANETTQ